MSTPLSACNPCCAPVVPAVNVPGSAGIQGPGAFTLTTADFVIPAIGSTVTVNVVSSIWIVVGQRLVVGQGSGAALVGPGPGTFQVTAIPSTTSVTLQFLGYQTDAATGATISSGAVVSPAGAQVFSLINAIATGAAFTFDNTAFPPGKAIGFGGNNPTVTLNAGTYLLIGRIRIDYSGATITNQTLSMEIRRTNNTPTDVTNSACTIKLRVVTTDSTTDDVLILPLITYTATQGDILQLYGALSAAAGAGNVTAVEATLTALRLF